MRLHTELMRIAVFIIAYIAITQKSGKRGWFSKSTYNNTISGISWMWAFVWTYIYRRRYCQWHSYTNLGCAMKKYLKKKKLTLHCTVHGWPKIVFFFLYTSIVLSYIYEQTKYNTINLFNSIYCTRRGRKVSYFSRGRRKAVWQVQSRAAFRLGLEIAFPHEQNTI